ncbi:N-alpha-acetyltransferase 80 isoform X2 [Malaya genurostris]|uniref:N-alpha-acetyltransferase 80 isoform X1 n=1 Tax=Malaya genurostris TaxID=325434 RepID=UPI0026F3FB0C|nr:N-alpha-acetyltransferase 80 isoform X1 [Malaya genurostris]XP_058468091.1 N-alpha-acetyltransferase 80 isoform X2 [Malaya genurostris]
MGKPSDLSSSAFSVVTIHQYRVLYEKCVQLINSEWPRSYNARLRSLEASRDTLPTSMVVIKNTDSINETTSVLAHARLSPVPSDSSAVFIESVVVDRRFRGQGLGKLLMTEVEKHCFSALHLKTIFLSTIDQDGFYIKLGYQFCKAINMFGTHCALNNSTKKIWLRKSVM